VSLPPLIHRISSPFAFPVGYQRKEKEFRVKKNELEQKFRDRMASEGSNGYKSNGNKHLLSMSEVKSVEGLEEVKQGIRDCSTRCMYWFHRMLEAKCRPSHFTFRALAFFPALNGMGSELDLLLERLFGDKSGNQLTLFEYNLALKGYIRDRPNRERVIEWVNTMASRDMCDSVTLKILHQAFHGKELEAMLTRFKRAENYASGNADQVSSTPSNTQMKNDRSQMQILDWILEGEALDANPPNSEEISRELEREGDSF